MDLFLVQLIKSNKKMVNKKCRAKCYRSTSFTYLAFFIVFFWAVPGAAREQSDHKPVSELEMLDRIYPDSLHYFNEMGSAYMYLKRYPEAINAYKESLAIDPKDGTAAMGLALVYILQGNLEDAHFYLEKVLDVNPENLHASLFSGLLYLKLGRKRDALPYFQNILEQEPSNNAALEAMGYMNSKSHAGLLNANNLLEHAVLAYLDHQISLIDIEKAHFYAEQKEYDQAIALLDQLCLRYPNNQIEYRLAMGKYFFADRRKWQAEEEFKKVLSLDGENREARYQLANLYMDEGKFGQAKDLLQWILKRDPANREANHKLSSLFFAEGKREKGLYYLRQMVVLGENREQDPMRYLNQGLYYAACDKWDEAKQEYGIALTLDPENSEIRLASAKANLRLGYLIEAEKDIKYVLDSAPQDVEVVQEAYQLQGQLYVLCGNYQQAVGVLGYILDEPPQFANVDYLNRLGRYYLVAAQPREAEQVFKRALYLQPANGELLLGLARSYANSGRAKQALIELRRLVRYDLSPSLLADAEEALGHVLLSQQEGEAALFYFKRAWEDTPISLLALRAYRKGLYFSADYQDGLAEEALASALQLLPEFSAAKIALIDVTIKLARVDLAEGMAKNYLAVHPQDGEALGLLSAIYALKGFRTKAAQAASYILCQSADSNDTNYLTQLGQYHLLCLNLQLAEQAFLQALIADPDNKVALFRLARVYAFSGRIESAQERMECLLKQTLLPSFRADVESALGDLYFGRENLPMAACYYDKAIQHTPRSYRTELSFRKGRRYEIDYNQIMAESAYRHALSIMPRFADGQIALARVLVASGQLEQAKQLLQKFIEGHPDNIDGYLAMGKSFNAEGNTDEACRYYAAILSEPYQPNSPDYFTHLGHHALFARQFSASQAAFKQALAIDPCHVQARLGLASSFSLANMVERKKCELESVLACYPQNAEALLGLGSYYLSKQEFALACGYFQAVVAIDPSSWSASRYIWLTDKLHLLKELMLYKRYGEAIALLQKEIICAFPYDPSNYVRLGGIYLTLKQEEMACAAFTAALTLNSEEIDARIGMARLYLKQGRVLQAKEMLLSVVERDPENSEAIAALAGIYAGEGHYKLAYRHYRQSLLLDPKDEERASRFAFLCHDLKIDQLLANSCKPVACFFKALHSKELGKNPLTEKYNGALYTLAWFLKSSIFCTPSWTFTGELSKENERDDDLENHIKVFDADLYTLKLGASWQISSNWNATASLGALRGMGHSQGPSTKYLIQDTYRFQPSVALHYESISPPLFQPFPPPSRRHAGSVGFYRDTIVPFFSQTREAHLIDIQHFIGSYEYRPLPPFCGLGSSGEWRSYQDPAHNYYRGAALWARATLPWCKNAIELRAEFNYRAFNTPVQQYYSYKRQIEPLLKISLQKHWCFEWQATFFYSHGWRDSRDLINPLQTGPVELPFQKRQFLNTSIIDGTLSRNIYDSLTLAIHGYYYWDSSSYRVYTFDGTFAWNF